MVETRIPRLGSQSTWVGLGLGALLVSPAAVTFGIHLLEQAIPLGISRPHPDGILVPAWLAAAFVFAAQNCTLPTWLGMGFGALVGVLGSLRWYARAAVAVLVAWAYISMRDLNALVNSCWGEAPHFPWCRLLVWCG